MSWYLPDGQCTQLVRPVQALNCPAWHCRHELEVDGWYVPSAQSVHVGEPSMAYWPLAHAAHVAALYEPEYRPVGHTPHVCTVLLNVPGMQAGVGLSVGEEVGALVGSAVGNAVGSAVGAADGDGVGNGVGVTVGFGVGETVGTGVHSVCDCLPSVHVPRAQPWHRAYSVLS